MSLLSLSHLSEEKVLQLVHSAIAFKNGKKVNYHLQKVVATLFFESSTRTHYSFIMAAKKLGCEVIDFAVSTSSLTKNESFYDTVKFFETIETDAIIIRSKQENYYDQLENLDVSIINGGDGAKDHPTQSLLDLMTIHENFNRLSNLKILIVGDIKHSRVAHSNIDILQRLNNDVYLSGPTPFQESSLFFVDIDEYIDKVDVVMLLRVQFERHETNYIEKEAYLNKYGLNKERYAKLKKDAIIMHPAPINRGIEIDDCLVEADKSRIFAQMNNGVYVRMAVLHDELG